MPGVLENFEVKRNVPPSGSTDTSETAVPDTVTAASGLSACHSFAARATSSLYSIAKREPSGAREMAPVYCSVSAIAL